MKSPVTLDVTLCTDYITVLFRRYLGNEVINFIAAIWKTILPPIDGAIKLFVSAAL